MPDLREREGEIDEGREVDGVLIATIGREGVLASGQLERLSGAVFGVDDPVVGDAGGLILLELIDLVDGGGGGTEDFNAEVRGPFHGLFADEVEARFGEEDDVGTTDVVG